MPHTSDGGLAKTVLPLRGAGDTELSSVGVTLSLNGGFLASTVLFFRSKQVSQAILRRALRASESCLKVHPSEAHRFHTKSKKSHSIGFFRVVMIEVTK